MRAGIPDTDLDGNQKGTVCRAFPERIRTIQRTVSGNTAIGFLDHAEPIYNFLAEMDPSLVDSRGINPIIIFLAKMDPGPGDSRRGVAPYRIFYSQLQERGHTQSHILLTLDIYLLAIEFLYIFNRISVANPVTP